MAPKQATTGVSEDAERLYREALERREAIHAEWVRCGRRLLSEGSTGQLVEHPLVKMLREHDMLLDRLAVPLRKRHAGPDPSAVIVPSIGESPAARLRSVK
jgi:hypothetical protein